MNSTMHVSALGQARTFLFVPGTRAERFAKALGSGADAVVLDLEDSVPQAAKPAARDAICGMWPDLLASRVPIVIRVNSISTEVGRVDLDWLARLPAPAGVMVSKVEAGDLEIVGQAIRGLALLPLIESATGLDALPRIARSPNVLRLVVGHIDFMADTGMSCSEDERELAPLRFAVAMQTRLCGLAPAIDGVTVAIDDDERLRTDTRRALNFGFAGKLCIHPRQVEIIHGAMAPNAVEVEWARRVLVADQAAGGAAFQLDGRMIDLPVVLQARRTLARVRAGESG